MQVFVSYRYQLLAVPDFPLFLAAFSLQEARTRFLFFQSARQQLGPRCFKSRGKLSGRLVRKLINALCKIASRTVMDASLPAKNDPDTVIYTIYVFLWSPLPLQRIRLGGAPAQSLPRYAGDGTDRF